MIKTRKLQIWKNMPVKIGFSKKHQIPTSYFISKKSYKWFKAASSDTFTPAFACLNRVKTYSVNLYVSLAKRENGCRTS